MRHHRRQRSRFSSLSDANRQNRNSRIILAWSIIFLLLFCIVGLFSAYAQTEVWNPDATQACMTVPPSQQIEPWPSGHPQRLVRKGEMPKQDEMKDKTLAPYFLVTGEESDLDELPLKATRATAKISGVIADVTVTQVYKNEGKKTLEAIYVFPASTRAAVHAASMSIGERRIEAKIQERDEARKQYEQARQEGQTAALLEQQRPNVFQMNVLNILPGDEIKVELNYTELLIPEDGLYEFIYPTVVGPRYSNISEKEAGPTEFFVKNPYLHEGQNATYTFGLALSLNSPLPISEIASPSHDLEVDFKDKNHAEIRLAEDVAHGNRDVVIRYSLADRNIQTGVMTYRGEKENFFLLMMEPPKRTEQKEIVPREMIFIVDVSGSMNGFPLDVSKELMHNLLSGLRSVDSFNILTFAGDNRVFAPESLRATPDNVQKALTFMNALHSGGGTELLPALKQALAFPHETGMSRIVVIATDGFVRVEREAFELIHNNLGEANFFPFGIGSSVNRHLIEGMAHAGKGEAFVVLNSAEAKKKAERFQSYIQSPVLQGIAVEMDEFNASDLEPLQLPDLFAERPVVLFGKFKGDAKGTIRVSGRSARGTFRREIAVTADGANAENKALRELWARQRVMRLNDLNVLFPNEEEKKQITELGLKYSLLTPFTSFIAVDSLSRAKDKASVVKQPLPLPQGVTDMAVSGTLQMAMNLPGAPRGYGGGGAALGLGGVGRIAESSAKHTMGDESTDKNKTKTQQEIRIELSQIEVQEAVDKIVIERTFRKHFSQIRHMYQQELKANPTLNGQVTLALKVGTNGQVEKVVIKNSTVKSTNLERRLVELIRRIAFQTKYKSAQITVQIAFSMN